MDGRKPDDNQPAAPTQFAPGDTIRPQQASSQNSVDLPAPTSSIPESQPNPPPAAPSIPAQPAAQQEFVPQTPSVDNQPATMPLQPSQAAEPSFFVDDNQQFKPIGPVDTEAISWTASEYIAHSKNSGWYALVLLGACVGAVLVWLITKDILSAIVVVFAGALFATYAARKPRELSYQLDSSGITIGQRHYTYNEFRSFSVVQEGAFSSIVFTPLKRFGMLTTVYYDPQDEDRILNAISQRLPHEERRPDVIDSVVHRMRF